MVSPRLQMSVSQLRARHRPGLTGAHQAKKKADVSEYVAVFEHVGLRNNEPPRDAGMLFV